MNRSIISLSLMLVAINGCTNVNKKSALGDFDYANNKEQADLIIPENLDKPKYKKDFLISSDINHNGPIGKAVDVRAPSLALPIAAATRVENKDGKTQIWFDKVIEEKDVQAIVYQAIVDYLESQNASLASIDQQNLRYQSDWLLNEKEQGWIFTSNVKVAQKKFGYQLETKPHGRSVGLMVELLDYQTFTEEGEQSKTEEIDLIDKERFEMAMLNEIIGQVDFQYRQQRKDNALLAAKQNLVSIGKSNAGKPAYIVEMSHDLVWSNMPILFSKYGFEVDDLNESTKVYYVTYNKPEQSIWDSIWGDEIVELPLEDGQYQFTVAPSGDNTSVTISDTQQNLSKEALERMFDIMQLALSFKDSL